MDAKTLALYLGCDVMHIDGNSKYNGKYQLLLIDLERNNGVMRSYEHNGVVFRFNHFHDKLLLRPLSSMTEEDARKIIILLETIKSDDPITVLKLNSINIPFWLGENKIARYVQFNALNPKQFSMLLSKGFDLFGLIDKGEAIDATK